MVHMQQQCSLHQIKQPGLCAHPTCCCCALASVCVPEQSAGLGTDLAGGKKIINKKEIFHTDQFARLTPWAAEQTAELGHGLVQRGMKEECTVCTATQPQFISTTAQDDLGDWKRHLGLADLSASAVLLLLLSHLNIFCSFCQQIEWRVPPPDYGQPTSQTWPTLSIAAVCFPCHLFPTSSQGGWDDCKMFYFWLRKCDSLYSLSLSGGNVMPSLT